MSECVSFRKSPNYSNLYVFNYFLTESKNALLCASIYNISVFIFKKEKFWDVFASKF